MAGCWNLPGKLFSSDLRYKLLYTFRAHLSDANSYNCVYQKQDDKGNSALLSILSLVQLCCGLAAISQSRFGALVQKKIKSEYKLLQHKML